MRERLGQYYQQTHCFTARFTKFSKTVEGSNVACFCNVMIANKFVADHIWVHRSKHMKRLELQNGDIVQFQATVGHYVRGEGLRLYTDPIEYDYNLGKIREFAVLKRREGSNDENG